MKKIELLVGDYEYSHIEEIFENEKDFKPVNEQDQVIIKALKEIINKKNLKEENVGGKETASTTVKKVHEPENKSLDEKVEFKI